MFLTAITPSLAIVTEERRRSGMSFSRTPSVPSHPRGSKDAPRFRVGTALSVEDRRNSTFEKRKKFDKQRRSIVKEKELDFIGGPYPEASTKYLPNHKK